MMQSRVWISPIGYALASIFTIGLAIAFWTSGERMFSPGHLSAANRTGNEINGFKSHAEFERQCEYCHQPFESKQNIRCLNCHTVIDAQITNQEGLHGKLADVNSCRDCHPDHRGTDYNMVAAARVNFDHDLTRFTLLRHQVDYRATPMSCVACHAEGDFSLQQKSCMVCHEAEDSVFMEEHTLSFGAQCMDCHDGFDHMARFDHSSTRFILDGSHEPLSCVDCHHEGEFEGTPIDCASCHAEPETHAGVFAPDCSDCHTTQSWESPQLDGQPFQHESSTRFSLVNHRMDYQEQVITCLGCHIPTVNDQTTQTCVDCHSLHDPIFMDEHILQFGLTCVGCHDGIDRMRGFDHQNVFSLDGRHADIDCEQCHIDKVFGGTPSECIQCHEESPIHAGVFGVTCQYCHTTDAWIPAPLRLHTFPLDHGEGGEVACQTCHTDNYFLYTCYGCHDHQPDPILASHSQAGISPVDLPECATCHANGLINESLNPEN